MEISKINHLKILKIFDCPKDGELDVKYMSNSNLQNSVELLFIRTDGRLSKTSLKQIYCLKNLKELVLFCKNQNYDISEH